MMWSDKQREFFAEGQHRWNIKCGATRSGKTFMDYYLIPKRIRAVAGLPGTVLILGNTKGTLQANIIEPLRSIWGAKLVSDIRTDNTAMLFGEKCYCLGADKVSQVDRIRGRSVKYCYGDEVVTWHPEVFNMIKSRMDKEWSKFDGTCNPEGRTHWFKRFLDEAEDKGIDLYCQRYTLDDNPFLPSEVAGAIKAEYAGTVYYNRYVLGEWTNAEGLIYRSFADDPDKFIVKDVCPSELLFATIGVDFGGGKSAHAFSCTAYAKGFKYIVTVADYHRQDAGTPAQLYEDFFVFLQVCRERLRGVTLVDVYCDSAEQTLIGGLRSEAARRHAGVEIHNARKYPINDRIRFYCILQGAGRYRIHESCRDTIDAFRSAMWTDKATADVRLDDGSTNIDNLDAQEYSTEPFMRDMVKL
jgi:PBSX family phage terminase large subunit